MTRTPDVALRIRTIDGAPAWAIANDAVRQWRDEDPVHLLSTGLRAAMDVLAGMPAGLLVGLLPYPSARRDSFPTETHSVISVFDQAIISSDIPQSGSGGFRLLSGLLPDSDDGTYLAGVKRIQDYLRAGDVYQVNLARRLSGRYEGDPWCAFQRVVGQHEPPHAAWLRLPDRDLLSFSPESFLSLEGGLIVTRPIKGTRPRHVDPEMDTRLAADLASHPKDRAENLMIVDLLRNDLGRVCEPGSVRTPSLFELQSFRNIHHLVSTVTGRLRADCGLPELLLACFPGGSITGAPKRRAMEIIDELEPHPRDVYCGTVFWIRPDGSFGSNILIRSFLARDGVIHGWAGAGIVADSSPEAELQECRDKLQPIIDLMS